MEPTIKDIMKEIKQLRIDVNIIKKNMADIDSILTDEEESRHEESLNELERGETFSLEDVERERAKNA
ncbi:hypothetical protein GF386_01930 [Candidatus Pacearchaeota archaeon]|nr:hypothetical protein [Candidatus Pacearchaeota archaeon]